MAPRSSSQTQSLLSPCRILVAVSVALLIFCLVLRNEIQTAFSSYRLTSQLHICTPELPTPFSSSASSATISTVFGQDPSLDDTSSLGDEAWSRKLQTPQGGFLWVRYNETLKEGWGISMFHALHCLNMIRAEMVHSWSLMESTPRSQGPVHEYGESIGDMKHMEHCLAYIAESLLCAADGTIEPPVRVRNAAGHIITSSVDGEGYTHECKRSDFLFRVAARSEEQAFSSWDWKQGDMVESVFRGLAL